jgi:hypothetical protein
MTIRTGKRLAAAFVLFLATGAVADPMPSGKEWVAKFPGSARVEDLEKDFRGNVEAFLKALRDGGATVRITSTLRPPERAYLMHWAWMIVRKDADPKEVPALKGVDITWWLGDRETSKKKAQEMVDGFGLGHLQVAPALKSRHTEGKAIDLVIGWRGTLKIKMADDKEVAIDSEPRDGTNPKLIEVGASYGVIHFKDADKDRVHWSTDGR